MIHSVVSNFFYFQFYDCFDIMVNMWNKALLKTMEYVDVVVVLQYLKENRFLIANDRKVN